MNRFLDINNNLLSSRSGEIEIVIKLSTNKKFDLMNDEVEGCSYHIFKKAIFKIREVILDPRAEANSHLNKDLQLLQTHLKVPDLFVSQTPETLFYSYFFTFLLFLI